MDGWVVVCSSGSCLRARWTRVWTRVRSEKLWGTQGLPLQPRYHLSLSFFSFSTHLFPDLYVVLARFVLTTARRFPTTCQTLGAHALRAQRTDRATIGARRPACIASDLRARAPINITRDPPRKPHLSLAYAQPCVHCTMQLVAVACTCIVASAGPAARLRAKLRPRAKTGAATPEIDGAALRRENAATDSVVTRRFQNAFLPCAACVFLKSRRTRPGRARATFFVVRGGRVAAPRRGVPRGYSEGRSARRGMPRGYSEERSARSARLRRRRPCARSPGSSTKATGSGRAS